MTKYNIVLSVMFVILIQFTFAQKMQEVTQWPRTQQADVLAEKNWLILKWIDKDMNTWVAPPEDFLAHRTPGATFDVTYNGFSPTARTAFQFAVDIWASLINSSVPIKVKANWTPLAPGVLGSASASRYIRNFPGAPMNDTWYPIALAEKLNGSVFSPDTADIVANFNSNFSNWYLGTDGQTPSGEVDLVTVVLHELCHGLGFLGSMSVDSASGMGSWGLGSGFPFIYDHYTENGPGQQLINTTNFPNPSTALANQLTGDDLFFNGPEAVGANSGNRPKLYAPSNWEQGSSYSHLDETTFPPGNPNSLMTPQIGNAEPIHAPGPVTLGIFRDMGWSTQSGGGTSVVKWEETFTSGSPPPNWLVVDNDGSGDALEYRQLVVFQGGDTVQPQIAQSFWFGNFSNANSSGLIDEWLITPRVQNIDAGDSLYFWAGAIGGSFDDSLKVFVSTTGNSLSDFTNQIAYFKVDGPVSSWHQYGFDLTPFNGEDIYIAVNYYIVDGGPAGTHSDNVWIDHFLITTDSVTGISDPDRPIANRIPQGYSLQQNYPNPFNPVTHIPFSLSKAGHVKIEVYNSLGQKVTSLLNEYHPAGRHEVAFDAHRFSSGIYYYQLEVNGFRQVKKMLLMR